MYETIKFTKLIFLFFIVIHNLGHVVCLQAHERLKYQVAYKSIGNFCSKDNADNFIAFYEIIRAKCS